MKLKMLWNRICLHPWTEIDGVRTYHEPNKSLPKPDMFQINALITNPDTTIRVKNWVFGRWHILTPEQFREWIKK